MTHRKKQANDSIYDPIPLTFVEWRHQAHDTGNTGLPEGLVEEEKTSRPHEDKMPPWHPGIPLDSLAIDQFPASPRAARRPGSGLGGCWKRTHRRYPIGRSSRCFGGGGGWSKKAGLRDKA